MGNLKSLYLNRSLQSIYETKLDFLQSRKKILYPYGVYNPSMRTKSNNNPTIQINDNI